MDRYVNYCFLEKKYVIIKVETCTFTMGKRLWEKMHILLIFILKSIINEH